MNLKEKRFQLLSIVLDGLKTHAPDAYQDIKMAVMNSEPPEALMSRFRAMGVTLEDIREFFKAHGETRQ